MTKTALLLLLALNACAGAEPLYRPVTVEMPVPCPATLPPLPAEHFPSLQPGDSLFIKTRALLADYEHLKAFVLTVREARNRCVLPPTNP